MNHYPPLGRYVLSLILFSFLYGCCVPSGIREMSRPDFPAAEAQFQKCLCEGCKHRVPALYHYTRLKAGRAETISEWLSADSVYCLLEDEISNYSVRRQRKWAKWETTKASIRDTKEQLQQRIFKRMATGGTIAELKTLEASAQCWSDGRVDSLRRIIVNRTVNPRQSVYGPKGPDANWQSPPLPAVAAIDIKMEPSRSCLPVAGRGDNPWGITYEDAITIGRDYKKVIMKANYPAFWNIRENIWELFQFYHSYCDMDRFRAENDRHEISNDCWFEAARDTLCLGQLRPLLAFHQNNRYTALDMSVVQQILCLAAYDENTQSLSKAERQQVEDVKMMLALQQQFVRCQPAYDSIDLITHVATMAQEYPYHDVPFDVAASCVQYYADRGDIVSLREAARTLRPLFPDTTLCDYNGYFARRSRQQWFDLIDTLAARITAPMEIPEPQAAWNTPTNDEYGLVSWGGTDEVFFARGSRRAGVSTIMTSRLEKGEWTEPEEVAPLAMPGEEVPLSISSNGRMLLLQTDEGLMRSLRLDVGRKWGTPEPFAITEGYAGTAWVSPNDSLLFLDYQGYSDPMAPAQKSIGYAQLQAGDHYSSPMLVPNPVSQMFSSESDPILALGGRLLFFSSDRMQEGIDEYDLFSVSLSQPGDWSTMGEPTNLGLQLSSIFDDDGITYFSEYSGKAYFHEQDQCKQQWDILSFTLGADIFPANAMRLAGVVVDEKGAPLSGGFMEVTPNYQLEVDGRLNVHSEVLSPKGTYTYTVEDSTEVVRLFPEVPGYYSERDAVHSLATVKPGEIIRDTFVLLSFDYIIKNFKLENSTFHQGTAVFNQPARAYPEINRLAKIALRMGANLEINGHTDETGGSIDNIQLSRNRADAVRRFLIEECGFPASRIRTDGFGDTRPIASNDTEEGRRLNRRVEIVFRMPELD